MKQFFWILLLSFVGISFNSPQQYKKYIDGFKDIAIWEMGRTSIPASIKLAQGILESNAGTSTLATEANNHFGIKCGGEWNEKESFKMEDDDYDHRGKKIKSCFRKYDSAAESFIAHSEFLRDPNKSERYGHLFELEPTDYVKWAYGLRKSGYATDPKYPNKLISIIENYKLYQFDYVDPPADFVVAPPEVSISTVKKTSSEPQRIFQVNSVNCVKAKAGDTPAAIANRFDVTQGRIMRYNEQFRSKSESIKEGTIVFLQKKRSRFYGRKKYHNVKSGETVMDVSIQYGIEYASLCEMNEIPRDFDVVAGQKVSLRKKVKKGKGPKYVAKEDKKEERVVQTEQKKANASSSVGRVEKSSMISSQTRPLAQSPSTISKEDVKTGPVSSNPQIQIPTDDEFLPFEIRTSNTIKSKKPIAASESRDDDLDYILRKRDYPVEKESIVQEEEDGEYLEFVVKLEKAQGVLVNESPGSFHIVKKGETLYGISRIYKVSVDEIKHVNELTSNTISIGQKLKIKR